MVRRAVRQLAQPIFDRERGDPRKLAFIVCDERVAERYGVGRDQEVVGSDDGSSFLQATLKPTYSRPYFNSSSWMNLMDA